MNSPINIWREHKNLRNYLGKTGKVLVWTKILVPPAGFEHQAPYIVGIIQFEDKEKLPAQIVDCEEQDLKLNQKVKVVIRKIGKVKSDEVIEYGVKVKPL
ncbi:OB-fold domain-containing protein [Candidatus Daviesbacteria bacterium]|nr:OB-fold domain-containing protein [Candidatus Daviesbacteria bacterium]